MGALGFYGQAFALDGNPGDLITNEFNAVAPDKIVAGPPENPSAGVNDTWALYVWNGDPAQQPTLIQLLPGANYLTGGAWEAILSAPSLTPGTQVRLIADSGDTLWFGTSSLIEFGKSYSQSITQ